MRLVLQAFPQDLPMFPFCNRSPKYLCPQTCQFLISKLLIATINVLCQILQTSQLCCEGALCGQQTLVGACQETQVGEGLQMLLLGSWDKSNELLPVCNRWEMCQHIDPNYFEAARWFQVRHKRNNTERVQHWDLCWQIELAESLLCREADKWEVEWSEKCF
jgi:hypothetical protein